LVDIYRPFWPIWTTKCYADDIQLFVSVEPSQISDAIKRVERFFGTKPLLKKLPSIELHMDGAVIRPSDCVRNLGTFMDKNLTMEKHINRLVSASFSYLRVISRVRRSLSRASCKLLINALVFSRIDYCGSLLVGISGKCVNKIQKSSTHQCG
jgi:hypothetical protein